MTLWGGGQLSSSQKHRDLRYPQVARTGSCRAQEIQERPTPGYVPPLALAPFALAVSWIWARCLVSYNKGDRPEGCLQAVSASGRRIRCGASTSFAVSGILVSNAEGIVFAAIQSGMRLVTAGLRRRRTRPS
jgi:hypothetical protein